VAGDGARLGAALAGQGTLVGAILEGGRLRVVLAEIRRGVADIEDVAAFA